MSKWINKDMFNKFVDEKKNEVNEQGGGFGRDFKKIWPTPEKGTDAKPKIYEGRFLPDNDGNFYNKYFYHMHKVGEKWFYSLCPKTYNMDNFCLLCNLAAKLYTGSDDDKKLAYQYKRKERYVANFFIENDERDKDRKDEDKVEGTVKLYEFPAKIESKLRSEVTDKQHGLGLSIFDPSDEGYSFIIKVKSTKPQADGKIWPDYSDSIFARKPHAIADNEKKIDTIMKTTHSITEYIASMEKSNDDVIKAIKDEMLWDLVENDYNRYMKVNKKTIDKEVEEQLDEVWGGNAKNDDEPEEETPKKSKKESDSDEDILKELENL